MARTPTPPLPSFRVLRIPKATKRAASKARDAAGLPMRDWLCQAVAERLPALLHDLAALGFVQGADPKVLARWQITPKALASLRTASKRTGLPAQTLLCLCVVRASSRRSRRPSRTQATRS
jgi:hypothetical protein